MSAQDYVELVTVEDFRAALAEEDRIVITDRAGTTKVHDPRCHTFAEADFEQKVITNRRKSGRYFRARNTTIAEEHGAIRCRACYD